MIHIFITYFVVWSIRIAASEWTDFNWSIEILDIVSYNPMIGPIFDINSWIALPTAI